MDSDISTVGYIVGALVGLAIFYYILINAVASGMKKQNELLAKQNDILIKMLNVQGVSRQELQDLFLEGKKSLWITMKDYPSTSVDPGVKI